MQSDPIGLRGGLNTYGYAYQNPTIYSDLNGLNPGAGCVVGSLAGPAGCGAGAIIGTIALGIGVALNIPGDTSSDDGDNCPGDLTPEEIEKIQEVVDEAGRPLTVIGSAAEGNRRNPGADVPFGKEDGEKSDIDYVVPPSSLPAFDGLEDKLPEIDPATGIVPGNHNPYQGPGIRFEPGADPVLVPKAN